MSGFQLQRQGMLMEPEPGNPNEVEGVLNPAVDSGVVTRTPRDHRQRRVRHRHRPARRSRLAPTASTRITGWPANGLAWHALTCRKQYVTRPCSKI
jgi:hypothetical protein